MAHYSQLHLSYHLRMFVSLCVCVWIRESYTLGQHIFSSFYPIPKLFVFSGTFIFLNLDFGMPPFRFQREIYLFMVIDRLEISLDNCRNQLNAM